MTALHHAHVAADALVSALFAPLCVSCHAVLDSPTRSPACDACWRNLRAFTPPLCDRCGEPVAAAGGRHACAVSQSALTCCRAVGWYEDVLRDLIHAVKYDERRTLAAALAALSDSQCRRSDRRGRAAGARAAAPLAAVVARVQSGGRHRPRACQARSGRHGRARASTRTAYASAVRSRRRRPPSQRPRRFRARWLDAVVAVAAAPVESRIGMSCSLMT